MNKSYYFSHDYNAANDAKILFLRQQLGMEGYGIFWFVVEQLAQGGGRLPMKIVPVLAMQCGSEVSKVGDVIEGYDLFDISDGYFTSSRLNRHVELRRQLSEMGRKGVAIREARREASRGASSLPSSYPSSKESKGNERKDITSMDREFPLVECKAIAMRDNRWVEKNKIDGTDLDAFNLFLEKGGIYNRHVGDYKTHYRNWRAKNPKIEIIKPIKNKLDEIRARYSDTSQ